MSLRRTASHLVCLGLAATLGSSCAARRFTPPSDSGTPLTAFADVLSALTAPCAGVQTFTAELGLSGRAGAERLRGRVVAGFLRPDSMRLEGVAPLGPPAFVLVSSAGNATLLLPRENAVLRGARPDEVLEALTGVLLQPADLQAVLTGCVTPNPRPSSGRAYSNGWVSITTEAGATLYARREGDRWQLRAARRGQWLIEYPAWQGSFPALVHLRAEGGPVPVDVSATVSQLEANVTIDAGAFAVDVPSSALPVSLDQLRQSGPLRGQP